MNAALTDKIRNLLARLPEGLPEKDLALRLSLLAFLAGESVFLLGPPGVAKSLMARRLKHAFAGARAFEYLMGRFSTPEEIFGPLSIAGLRDRDEFERKTSGYLPEADLVFLDEIWRASPPIQNALLTVLNEKIFRNGSREVRVPLKGFVAAANRIPENDETAEAFWDRFLLRLVVKNLEQEESFLGMLQDRRDLYESPVAPEEALTEDEYTAFSQALAGVEIPPAVQETLLQIRRRLRALEADSTGPTTTSVYVSDRRWKKAVKILKASALIHGRNAVEVLDVFLLDHCFWNHLSHRPLVRDLITASVQDQGIQPPFQTGELEARYKDLHRQLQGLVRESREVEVSVPVLYQQEYYTVSGFRPSVVTRIWAEDFDLLADGKARECEVYFFAKGYTYSFSEKHQLQRLSAEAEVQVDGQSFALESQVTKRTVVQDRTAEDSQMGAWEKEARIFSAYLEELQIQLKEYRQRSESRGQDHLFVPPASVPATLQRLDAAAQVLSDLRIRVQRLISLRQPEANL